MQWEQQLSPSISSPQKAKANIGSSSSLQVIVLKRFLFLTKHFSNLIHHHILSLFSADGSGSPGKISFDCWISEYAKARRHSLLDAFSPRRHKKAGSDGGRLLAMHHLQGTPMNGSVPDGLRRSMDQLNFATDNASEMPVCK